VKRSALFVVIAVVGAARLASAATFADADTMRVDIAGATGDVCAVTPAPGIAPCAPAATDPTPEQRKSMGGEGGELLLMAKAPLQDTTCIVTIVRNNAMGVPAEVGEFERGAREGAQRRGAKLRELHTVRTTLNGRAAVESTMTMDVATGSVYSVTYLVGAGRATYMFTFTGADPAGALDVARATMATFKGAPSKPPVSKAYALGYAIGNLGVLALIAAVVIGGSIFAARQGRIARP
jgi:hypothetical protein